MMENKVFRLPTVGGLLRERYVEARLHNDDHANPELMERVAKLQDELAQTRGVPYYLVVDPKTGKTLGRFPGPDRSGEDYFRWLQKFAE